MQYLDDYVDKIHYLPLDVNRNLRLIQELDKRATKANDLLEQYQEELKKSLQANGVMLASKKGYSFNEEQKNIIQCIDKTQTEYYHLCEEKCKVADQIYQEIQLQHDELNNETKRFVGENPQLKANQSPIAQTPILENDFIPTQLKKKKKNEEKKAQKIKEANDLIDSQLNSPIKSRNYGADSPIRSFQEGHGYSNQNNQGNNSSYIPFGRQYGSANNLDKASNLDSIKSNNIESIKSSKRQTKSKYASSNREEQKYCCGQKIESSYIQCDRCYSWYHHSCVGFEQNFIPSEDWFCSKCKGDVETYSATSFSVSNKLATTRSNGNTSVRKSKLSNN